MEVINYSELPQKAKVLFDKKIELELTETHKKAGLEKPKQWQVKNRIDLEVKNLLFHNDHGTFYSFKMEKIKK